MKNIDVMIRWWNAGSTLKETARYMEHKYNTPKSEVVKAFRQFSKQVGYSGMMPINKIQTKKPYGIWQKISDSIEYNREKNIYWNSIEKKVRCELSANWAGWIGKGSTLKDMVKKL